MEFVLIQASFLTVGSKQKIITTNARNTMASSYYPKVRSTQNKGATPLIGLGHGLTLALFSHVLMKPKFPLLTLT